MKRKSVLIIMLGFGLVPGMAFAQNPKDAPKREESIEELYLSSPGLRIAYEAARSDERESKLLAVSQINELIDEGMSAADEEKATVILRDLTAQGTSVLIREKRKLVNYFPDVRREACRVLASLKSEGARKNAEKVLIEVLNNDDDPIVKSQAVYSLGLLGLNENGEASRAIAHALEAQDYLAPNDNLAYSGCIALEKIAKANKGFNDASSLRILVRIAQGNYNRTVKEKALQVVKEIRTGSR
ncbi:MAG: HEAT repeat domain-containing protein [Spirochaetales bacterium]|nr:HEAT repeat domain-containing protein [Spirochaetales bacterium]